MKILVAACTGITDEFGLKGTIVTLWSFQRMIVTFDDGGERKSIYNETSGNSQEGYIYMEKD